MKKFNVNSILFIFVIGFIIAGIWGNCFTGLKQGTIDMFMALKDHSLTRVMDVKATIDTVSSEELGYHDFMMDVDSVKNNLLGTRVVFKEDITVVKADSGSLIEPERKLSSSDIEAVTARIQGLKEVAEENGAHFLYCVAPSKQYYEKAPGNVDNYARENLDGFLDQMADAHIPVLDFSEVLQNNYTDGSEAYYYTDHHWKTYSGFLACAALCDRLSTLYGFSYDKRYTDIQNYTVQNYPDWFLGSKGKKVGIYFTWHGADDFELITPDFETHLIEELPLADQRREGSFEETVLYMQNMEKDYYHKSAYTTYSGKDYRLQIIKNKNNPDGKKILIIRDSFACVVTPFLSLQTSELHVCDVRDYQSEAKMNMAEYIQEIKPDYVIVLYQGVGEISAYGQFDFF